MTVVGLLTNEPLEIRGAASPMWQMHLQLRCLKHKKCFSMLQYQGAQNVPLLPLEMQRHPKFAKQIPGHQAPPWWALGSALLVAFMFYKILKEVNLSNILVLIDQIQSKGLRVLRERLELLLLLLEHLHSVVASAPTFRHHQKSHWPNTFCNA